MFGAEHTIFPGSARNKLKIITRLPLEMGKNTNATVTTNGKAINKIAKCILQWQLQRLALKFKVARGGFQSWWGGGRAGPLGVGSGKWGASGGLSLVTVTCSARFGSVQFVCWLAMDK